MPILTRSELADLNVFLAIVRRRTFRQAAVELRVSVSALSHSIKHLESRLGVKLLNRTSRSVTPTMAGAELADQLKRGFGVISDALGKLDQYRDTPTGSLRLNVPRDAGRLLLTPILPTFLASYKDIQLEITLEDRLVDIVAEGYDAGIRYGTTVPKDMVAVPLTGPLRWVVVGSSSYISRHGRPGRPDDLLRHQCVRVRLGDNSMFRWELGDGERACEIDVPGPISVNDSDSCVQAAIDGIGLAYCLERRVKDQLQAGKLEVVLPEWSSLGPPFCMYYPSHRQLQPGLRQLIDCIRASAWTDANTGELSKVTAKRRAQSGARNQSRRRRSRPALLTRI